MTAPKLPEGLETIRALCAGRVEWRVARDDGAYCMSFNRDDSLNPEQEANEWLARHLCDYPERFMGHKVQRVVVQSQLQEEALALIVRLSDAQASLLAKEAECEVLREDAARYRWLHDGKNPGNRYPHLTQYPYQPDLDKVRIPQMVVDGRLRAENIDAAIDAALALAAKEAK